MSDQIALGTLRLNKHGAGLYLALRADDDQETQVFTGNIGETSGSLVNERRSDNTLEFEFSNSKLTVKHSLMTGEGLGARAHRYDVTWTGSADCSQLTDTFHIGDSHWYGAAQVFDQQWPIEKWQKPLLPFCAGNSFEGQYGGVIERYWLGSKGVAILITWSTPLFIAHNTDNNRKLTAVAKFEHPYKKAEVLTLQYSVFQADNVKAVHQAVLAAGAIARPDGIPDENVIRYPIWTTWARFKVDIDQEKVIKYAEEIHDNGFPGCQVEIDDDWTPRYGDMTFDPKKFPDPRAMTKRLQDLGFRTTAWVHPFANLDSEAIKQPCWITGDFDGDIYWWQGKGRYLDVTDPDAVTWYKSQLEKLRQDQGLASFKFDAGEMNYLCDNYKTKVELEHPSEYCTRYAIIGYELDPDVRCQEVRVGVRTQHLPVLVRMMDKDSCWGYNNGLKTLIPHCLLFSVIGYPFSLPDMIGGNAYHGSFPDRCLFVRWLQANVFMPTLQFSICPWEYDAEIIEICRDMVKLHEKYAQRIIDLARESTHTGSPINRPLWWIAPDDVVAQTLDSEFLLGDSLLVAPVLEEGAVSRDVYLPAGRWRDEVRGEVITGPQWYCNYPAPLKVLPYFTRLSEESSLKPSPKI